MGRTEFPSSGKPHFPVKGELNEHRGNKAASEGTQAGPNVRGYGSPTFQLFENIIFDICGYQSHVRRRALTSTRSICFCVIWVCISPSSSSWCSGPINYLTFFSSQTQILRCSMNSRSHQGAASRGNQRQPAGGQRTSLALLLLCCCVSCLCRPGYLMHKQKPGV